MPYKKTKIRILGLSTLFVLFSVCALYGQFRLLDQVRIKPINDQILAINSLRATTVPERIEGGEKIVAYNAAGLVGVAITNRRILGFSAEANAWSILRYYGNEKPLAKEVLVSPRLALVMTTKRAYVFSENGQWVKKDLISFDLPVKYYLSENVALVVTRIQALAFSAIRCDGWKSIELRLKEPVENVELDDTVATIDTPHRLLIFSAWENAWNYRPRIIKDSE